MDGHPPKNGINRYWSIAKWTSSSQSGSSGHSQTPSSRAVGGTRQPDLRSGVQPHRLQQSWPWHQLVGQRWRGRWSWSKPLSADDVTIFESLTNKLWQWTELRQRAEKNCGVRRLISSYSIALFFPASFRSYLPMAIVDIHKIARQPCPAVPSPWPGKNPSHKAH